MKLYYFKTIEMVDLVWALNIPRAPLLIFESGFAGATGGPPFPPIWLIAK
jgi:hypothetical protein